MAYIQCPRGTHATKILQWNIYTCMDNLHQSKFCSDGDIFTNFGIFNIFEIWYLLFSNFNAFAKLVLRIHWRLSTVLQTSSKSVSSNVFWYVKACIFWNCIQYTIHWNKTQMFEKSPSDKLFCSTKWMESLILKSHGSFRN